jgi:hypothetical protein
MPALFSITHTDAVEHSDDAITQHTKTLGITSRREGGNTYSAPSPTWHTGAEQDEQKERNESAATRNCDLLWPKADWAYNSPRSFYQSSRSQPVNLGGQSGVNAVTDSRMKEMPALFSITHTDAVEHSDDAITQLKPECVRPKSASRHES